MPLPARRLLAVAPSYSLPTRDRTRGRETTWQARGRSATLEREAPSMLIRIGYDIELAVTPPMTLLYLLRVHPSRAADLIAAEALSIAPALPTEDYVDSFGNRCA